MITKKQAHLLAAYEFRLVDKEGIEYKIKTVAIEGMYLVYGDDLGSMPDYYSYLNQIGKDVFILCRPYSQLTGEIEHAGERFVPEYRLESHEGIYIRSEDYEGRYDVLLDGIYQKAIDAILTWNFKPQWLDEKFVKYINQ